MALVEVGQFLNNLYFENIDQYIIWCRTRGYPLNTTKTWVQLNKEIQHRKAEVFDKTLRAHKNISIEKAVEKIKSGDLSGLKGEIYSKISAMSNGGTDKDILAFFHYLAKKSDLLEKPAYFDAIKGLYSEKAYWVRDYSYWVPKSHNIDKQFKALSRHLIAKYDVPEFMDSVWTDPGCSYYRLWFIMIGQGLSVRDLPDMPFPLTKKQCHHFLQAPPNYNVKIAPYWAQVRAQGGDGRLSGTLINSPFIRMGDLAFRDSIIKFFTDNPMLDIAHVGPVLDYIWNQKYQSRTVFVERGHAENMGPPQPNFSMTGRTPESLLNQVDRWHRQLGKEKKGGKQFWEHSKRISDVEFVEGNPQNRNMRITRIIELLSSDELATEGRYMHHCAASYAGSCVSGQCTIWSMTLENFDGKSRLITIEERHGDICQMRGIYNRCPTQQEMGYIRKWAGKNNLKLSGYMRI